MAELDDQHITDPLSPTHQSKGAHIIGLNESSSKKEEKAADQKLWLKLKVGSEEAFRELFLKYNHILTRYGHSIVNDAFIVEDCIHELFIYLWSGRDKLSDVESVKYYLIVSFRRRIFRVLEEKERGRKLLKGIRLEYPRHENFFEKKYLEAQDLIEKEKKINLVVDKLAPRQKEVLQLRYLDGLSYGEISDKMGISINSVRKQASKAIKTLRKNF
jgi:RNA polymerase sigma factor (sigma-70 family)